MKILIATTNIGKKKEMMNFFSNFLGLSGVSWLSLADLDEQYDDVEEYGETFMLNAMLKAEYYAHKTGFLTLGEDSGLRLAAFPGKFGVRTKREVEAKDDMDWLTKFLELMEEETERSASFFSAMCLYNPKNKIAYSVLGQTDGEILEFPNAPIEKGIPVSSVFVPSGQDLVYSAMNTAQKNKLSHRGKACTAMGEYISTLINKNV